LEVKISNAKISWANDINIFIEKYKDKAEWFIYCHDDVIIKTKDFFHKTMNQISGHEDKIGWITYTNPTYYLLKGEPRSATARPGFHKDRIKYPCIHECYKLDRKKHWNRRTDMLKLIETPNSPVKIFAPYSVFNLIKASALHKVGLCPDWTPYTILIDEHWGLKAQEQNLWNVWIPNIYYLHPIRFEARTVKGERWSEQAHKKFKEEWGYQQGCKYITEEVIKEIRQEYHDTNIPWSSYLDSNEWDYL
jgi:hypothetical protein